MMQIYKTRSIAISQIAERDQWGNPVGDPTITVVEGRVKQKFRKITNQAGKEVVSGAQVTVDAEVSIRPGDRVTIEGEANARAVITTTVEEAFSEESITIFLE